MIRRDLIAEGGQALDEALVKYIIDIPSPFDSTTRWQEFLDEMRTLPQDDPQVSETIEAAEKAPQKPGNDRE